MKQVFFLIIPQTASSCRGPGGVVRGEWGDPHGRWPSARSLLCAGAVNGDTCARPVYAKRSLAAQTSVFTMNLKRLAARCLPGRLPAPSAPRVLPDASQPPDASPRRLPDASPDTSPRYLSQMPPQMPPPRCLFHRCLSQIPPKYLSQMPLPDISSRCLYQIPPQMP